MDIRAGKFDAPKAVAATGLTFGALCDDYLRDHVRKETRRPHGLAQIEGHVRVARTTEIAPGVTLWKAKRLRRSRLTI